METATPGAPTAPTAPTANRQPAPSDAANRQAPIAKRYTRAEAAAALGVSTDSLRRLQGRSGVAGELVTAEHGGTVTLLSDTDLAALRLALGGRLAPTANRATPGAPTEPPGAKRQPPTDTGWSEAVAEARARADAAEGVARRAEAAADTLRAELAVARVDAQDARREAGEAMRALAATNERVGAMRAAWWRWRQQLETLGPVARWRRRWPVAPGEFEAEPLLAAPVE